MYDCLVSCQRWLQQRTKQSALYQILALQGDFILLNWICYFNNWGTFRGYRFYHPCIRHFGPRVYPLGSIVIALVRLSVRLSVFKYLWDRSLVFSEILHEERGQLSKKSDTAEILKKNLSLGIKCQKFGFLDIFSETGH